MCVVHAVLLLSKHNMSHRLSYAEWLLQEVVECGGKDMHYCVMYNIACNLHRYLKNSPYSHDLLERITFAIPAFHAYGHKADCQVRVYL